MISISDLKESSILKIIILIFSSLQSALFFFSLYLFSFIFARSQATILIGFLILLYAICSA